MATENPIIVFGDERLPARFWKKIRIHPVFGCWEWIASTSNGYGQFRARIETKLRTVRAHLYAYRVLIGPVQEGEDLDHFRFEHGSESLCVGRACVWPGVHTRPASRRENLLRGETITSAMAAKTHCPCGRVYDMVNENGWRRCSVCFKASKARTYARLKAEGGERWESHRRLQIAAKARYRARLREARGGT